MANAVIDAERVESPFRARAASNAGGKRRPLVTDLGLRAMTGFEEEVIEERLREPNTAALCNEILARCLVAPGADFTAALARVRQLLVVERDMALIQLRRRSLGDKVEMEVSCPACEMASEVDFQLGVVPLPGTDVPESLCVTTADGTEIELRLPTAADQEMLLGSGADLASESKRRTWLLARCITRLGNQQGPVDPDAVRALTTADRRALEQALEAALPVLDLGMEVTCSHCGHGFSSPFDVSAFFLPS